MNQLVTVKALTETTATVAGYGVIFGGADLEGDTFTKATNFMLDLVPQKLVCYDHTMSAQVPHVIGTVKSVTADETGLWVEAELKRSEDYVEAVLKLIERGVIGWSSGSVPHLVRREAKSATVGFCTAAVEAVAKFAIRLVATATSFSALRTFLSESDNPIRL